MNIAGHIILVIFVIACLVVRFTGNRKPSENKLQKQKEAYTALLKKYGVPDKHYKIVIGQSKAYSAYNCPALIWKEEGKIKILIMRLNPVLAEHEEEDFLFLASQPYVDFKRFDGTEFPDWAIQSKLVKEMFLPYVNLSKTLGGIDYERQMYWIGTICVYPSSLAQILMMMDRPLMDYDNRVEKKMLMLTDGALPEVMKEELTRELEKKTEAAPFLREEEKNDTSLQSMEKAIRLIRDTERKAGEKAATDQINRLYARLLSEKRYEDLERATEDEKYREMLFRELESD